MPKTRKITTDGEPLSELVRIAIERGWRPETLERFDQKEIKLWKIELEKMPEDYDDDYIVYRIEIGVRREYAPIPHYILDILTDVNFWEKIVNQKSDAVARHILAVELCEQWLLEKIEGTEDDFFKECLRFIHERDEGKNR